MKDFEEITQPIVDPMGAGERKRAAIQKIEGIKRELEDSRKRQLVLDARNRIRQNYDDSLRRFNEEYFGTERELDEEKNDALAALFHDHAWKYVFKSLLIPSGSIAGIIYLANHFSELCMLALIPLFFVLIPTFFSDYGSSEFRPGIDHHFKFLRARRRLRKIEKTEDK